MSGRRRRGLALIEVIAGAGMLLLLVALQVPAIARAREAARRAQCVNNLKQIILATTNYHSAWMAFPISAVVGQGHGNGQGCFTQILPYMEQTVVYNGYNFALENWHAANTTSVGLTMPSYLCPSTKPGEPMAAADIKTHQGPAYPGKAKFAPSHYGANWGGVRLASGADLAAAYPDPKAPRSHLGVILTVVDPDANPPTGRVWIGDVRDGSSATIAYAEKHDSFGWAVGGWGGTEFDVYSSPAYDGDDAKLRRAFTGSSHPEGINAAMVDGAVLFLKPTMDRKVWYALTTRAGGETVDLDRLKLRE